jgi:hypothetical protein
MCAVALLVLASASGGSWLCYNLPHYTKMPTLEDLQLEIFSVLLDSVLEVSRRCFFGVPYPQRACWGGTHRVRFKTSCRRLFVVAEQQRFWQMHFIECTEWSFIQAMPHFTYDLSTIGS